MCKGAAISVEEALIAATSAARAGKWALAESSARIALRARPTSEIALYVLASAMLDRGDGAEGMRLCQDAIRYTKKFPEAYRTLAKVYCDQDSVADAIQVYRKWLDVEPGNAEACHMLAALTGEDVPPTCSESYVREHFDQFSSSFDEMLVGRLAYVGPRLIGDALGRYRDSHTAVLDILDAGCGTGLCGEVVRSRSRRLVGVDISDLMIERARARGCYDELVTSELTRFMRARPGQFDVVVAADVLVYFGALEEVLEAANYALRRHGLIVFTVEALQRREDSSYRLQSNGRYAHQAEYVLARAAGAGFRTLELREATLRWEYGSEVRSYTFVGSKD